jgi:hypothetical protein
MMFFAVVVGIGMMCPLVSATTTHEPSFVFASFGFGNAVENYGFMSIESAFDVYPSIDGFILNIMKHERKELHSSMLKNTTNEKITYLRSMTKSDLFPTDSEGQHQDIMDTSHAHIRAIGSTLRYCQEKHPHAHVIFHDLDILHFQPTLLDAFKKPFTLGLMTRITQSIGGNNCGLIMFHNSGIDEAAAFFEFALQLYRDVDYIARRRSDPSAHSCCAQHVIQHALELIMGNGDWERTYSDYKYHYRTPQPDSIVPSCVAQYAGITNSFTLLSYPYRLFAPASDPGKSHEAKPTSISGALHYKSPWKKYMAVDFKKMTSMRAQGKSWREVAVAVFKFYKKNMVCHTPCCLEDVGCPLDADVRSPIISTCTKQPSFVKPANHNRWGWKLFDSWW